MTFTEKAWPIFEQVVRDYHKTDSIDAAVLNSFTSLTTEYPHYRKCSFDISQWHMEDFNRDPEPHPQEAKTSKACRA